MVYPNPKNAYSEEANSLTVLKKLSLPDVEIRFVIFSIN